MALPAFVGAALAALKTAAPVISAVGTGVGIVQQRQASQEAKRANRLERARANMEQVRNIRRAIAASRVQQAQVAAAGVEMQGTPGSGMQGMQAGVAASTGGSVGFAGNQFSIQQKRFNATGRADAAMSRAGIAQGISKIATAAGGQTFGGWLDERFGQREDS
jgi:hypothetical protein